jgi:glutamate--cysteine ligase
MKSGIVKKADLTDLRTPFLDSFKPKEAHRIGVEYELAGYSRHTLERLNSSEIETVLKELSYKGSLLFEGDQIVGATSGSGKVSVEPGGQIEYSSPPFSQLSEIEKDIERFLNDLRIIGEEHGFIFLATGFDPLRTSCEQNWFPKKRYSIMRPYLEHRGERSWDMMCRTCGMQTNMDYESEEDLSDKLTLGLKVSPIVTAIFANSPFERGTLSGFKSLRALTWLGTDKERTGWPSRSYKRVELDDFIDYALNVPIIYTSDKVSSGFTGRAFRDFLALDGTTTDEWIHHLSTIFTDVRLKPVLELRTGDSCKKEMLLALQAFWKGLLYSERRMKQALTLVPELSAEQERWLQEEVARVGLNALVPLNVRSLATDLIDLADEGLRESNGSERGYLDILKENVKTVGISPADILIKNWYGSWHKDIRRAIDYLSI